VKSIHSNHHAPSWDITHSFAHGSCICHILSGAQILICDDTFDASNSSSDMHGPLSEANVVVGKGPLNLIQKPNIITDYLGLDTLQGSTKHGEI
jgi:hypothetical protein